MTQMMQSQFLEEAARDLRRGRRCGLCRVYPGHKMVCGERGREVSARSRPCRVYDEMTAKELAEVKETKRAWREANKDKLKETKRAYYEANKDKLKETKRAWREANKDKLKETQRAYYEANKDKLKETKRAWREANKDKQRLAELLQTADPELYEQLLKEAKR